MEETRDFRVELADKLRAIDYFDGLSTRYDHAVNRGFLRWIRERERRHVLSLCALGEAGGSLIDVGCGSGFYSLVAKRAGYRVHSVDASPGMVMPLHDRVDEIEIADLDDLEPHATYDRVLCVGVLDFVVDPRRALGTLAALVGPGGRLILLAPRRGPGGWFYRLEKACFGIRVNLYRPAWIREVLEGEGLRLAGSCHPLPTNVAMVFAR